MNSENGKIWYGLGIDNTGLQADAKKSLSIIHGIGTGVEQEGNRMDSVFKKLTVAATAFFTAQQGMQLVNGIIKVRGEFQQLEIAFRTMLQSKEKADALMAQMVTLAAKTPFGLQDVAAGAKQLLAYGFAAEDITDNITRLGNIASGVGSQLGDLIYLYGTLKASGRVTQMDINQFAGRGIPIYAELAKVMGVGVDKVRDLVGAGQVGFPQIEKAFRNLTNQGGMFFNLMEAQSKSLTGQISNLQDSISQMFNEIGQSGEGLFSGAISGLSYLVENYKEVGKVLAVLITTYGAYRAALVLTSVAHATAIAGSKAFAVAETAAAIAGTRTTAIHVLQAGALNVLSAAQARFNAIASANPYLLIITAVAGLTAAYFILRDTSTSVERAQEALNERNREAAEVLEDLKNRTNDLTAAVNSQVLPMADRLVAYRRLQQLYPELLKSMSLEEFLLKGTAEQQRALNQAASNASFAKLKDEYDAASKKVEGLKKQIEDLKNTGGVGSFGNTAIERWSRQLEDAENFAAGLKKQIDEAEEAAKMASMTEAQKLNYYTQQKNELEKQIRQYEKLNGGLVRAKDGTISVRENLAAWSILGVLTQFNSLMGMINSINGLLTGKTEMTTPAQFKEAAGKLRDSAEQEADAAKRKAMLKQAEEYQKRYDQMMGKTNSKAASEAKKTASEQKRAIDQVTDAERQATIDRMAEGEKQVAEIRDRHRRMREALTEAGVKDPKQFAKIDSMEALAISDNQYQRDTKDIEKYLNNQKRLYQQFNEFKEKAGLEAANKEFAGKIQLNKTFDEIVSQSLENHIKAQVGKQATAATKARELMLRDFKTDVSNEDFETNAAKRAEALVALASYNQKREAIIRQHTERMKALGTSATADQLSESQNLMNEELAQLQASEAEKVSRYKEFTDEIIYTSKQAIQFQIRTLQALMSKSALPPEVKKEIQAQILELNNLLKGGEQSAVDAQFDREIKKREELIIRLGKEGKLTKEILATLTNEINRLRGDKIQIALEISDKNTKWLEGVQSVVQKLGETVSSIGGETSGFGSFIIGLSRNIGTLTNALNNLKKIRAEEKSAKGLSDETKQSAQINGYVAAAQFALSAIMKISEAAKQRREAEARYYAQVLGFQHELNLSLIEEQRIRSMIKENVFTTDYKGRIQDGLKAARTAKQQYDEELRKFADEMDDPLGKRNRKGKSNTQMKAKAGTRNQIDWGDAAQTGIEGAAAGAAVGIGAAIAAGAAVGSVVPIWGTVIGAVVGLGIGIVSATKKTDKWKTLMEEFPELIKTTADGQKELNVNLAKSLIAQDLVNDLAKQRLQNLIDLNEKYLESMNQVKEVVKEVSGPIGDQLRSALVKAFKDGEDSAKAFGDTVSKVLENMLSEMLFSIAFKDLFDQLQQDMIDSYDPMSEKYDESWADDVIRFYDKAGPAIDQFDKGLAMFREIGKQKGLNLFGPDSEADKKREGSQKGIASISQETGNELNGRFGVIQGHTFQISEGVKLMIPYSKITSEMTAGIRDTMLAMRDQSARALIHLAGIETNTGRLEAIEKDMRAVKTGIDDINLKGIKLKTI